MHHAHQLLHWPQEEAYEYEGNDGGLEVVH